MTTPTGSVKENLKNMPQAADRAINEARSLGEDGMDYLKTSYEDIQGTAKRSLNSTEDLIKDNPFYALAGAVAIGFVAGWLMNRSK